MLISPPCDMAARSLRDLLPEPAKSRRQRGYVLLVLLLFVALLSIGFLAAIRRIDFEIRRDREQELIHRGVQYSRAVRRYFKKFGRYPTRLEELESSNNIRFLRKRYKDPITGADFKLLHVTDVQLGFGPAIANGIAAQSITAAALQPGRPPGANGIGGGAVTFVQGGTSQSVEPGDQAAAGQAVASAASQGDASQQGPVSAGKTDTIVPPPQPLISRNGPGDAPQVFGGGAIVGVVSISKDKTIREFNKKNHYNQWQFIYDPSTDRGGLLMTPNQPPLLGAVQTNGNQQQPGAPTGFPAQNQGFGNNFPMQSPSPQAPAPQPPGQPAPAQQ